jgi:hypothetical protein
VHDNDFLGLAGEVFVKKGALGLASSQMMCLTASASSPGIIPERISLELTN